MKRTLAVLGATLSMGVAATALAGAPASLPAGGRTVGGPGVATIAASVTETVLSGGQAFDGCATVTNTGTAAVDLVLTGGGSATVNVPSRKTATLCRGSMQTTGITCLAVGTGTCSVSWRVDML